MTILDQVILFSILYFNLSFVPSDDDDVKYKVLLYEKNFTNLA